MWRGDDLNAKKFEWCESIKELLDVLSADEVASLLKSNSFTRDCRKKVYAEFKRKKLLETINKFMEYSVAAGMGVALLASFNKFIKKEEVKG